MKNKQKVDMNEANLTRTEQLLLLTLQLTSSQRAGRFSTEHHYIVSDEDRRAILELLEQRISFVVIGLRESGPPVTMEELSTVVDEMGRAAVHTVLGAPPSRSEGLN